MDAQKTVMVVEDDAAVRQMQNRILSAAGYQVSEAADGEIALQALAQKQAALVLLDVMMPGLSGFQVAQALRKNPTTAKIPIIFVTAKTETASVKQGFSAGASMYLTKPFTAQQLLAAVRTVIGSP
jgi:DNA-binding response OmpR family regulator